MMYDETIGRCGGNEIALYFLEWAAEKEAEQNSSLTI